MTTTTLTPKIVRRYPKDPVVVRCYPYPEQLAELREMIAGEPCLGCGQRFTGMLRLTAFVYSDRYVVALQPMGDLGGERLKLLRDLSFSDRYSACSTLF